MHDFIKRPRRHHVREIPLAPILDLLTVVIFFLLLSTSFIEMRQNTIPPSSTVVAKGGADVSDLIPLNPKLIMGIKGEEIILLLRWFGANPGQLSKTIEISKTDYHHLLQSSAKDLVKEFQDRFPGEDQIQLGWPGATKYQTVLTLVDGVMFGTKKIVFLSPEESEILFQKSF